jgi:hypothetical protein
VGQADLPNRAKLRLAEMATPAMPLEGNLFSNSPQFFQHFIHRILANGQFFLLRGSELSS